LCFRSAQLSLRTKLCFDLPVSASSTAGGSTARSGDVSAFTSTATSATVVSTSPNCWCQSARKVQPRAAVLVPHDPHQLAVPHVEDRRLVRADDRVQRLGGQVAQPLVGDADDRQLVVALGLGW
jgi:hypothetical protein